MTTFYNNVQLALVGELGNVTDIQPVFKFSISRLHSDWCCNIELMADNII